MEPRGVRNNNFGNIEDGPFARALPGYIGTDGRFARFNSPDDGMEAINRLLMNYGRKGVNNINGIVGRWAPTSDGNNVNAYASSVAQNTGYDPNAQLDMNDPAVRSAVARAIALHENGPGVKSKLPGAGGAMTPNARVQDGFMGLPMSPNERVADSFDAMEQPTQSLPPTARSAVAQAAPTDLAAAKAAGADAPWVGSTGNALMNVGSILGSLGSIDGKSIIPQLAQNAMALQQANKPQWGVIGEDLFGKKYGWINPNTQTVTGPTGAGGGAGSVTGGGSTLGADLTNFQAAIKAGETDKAKLLEALPDSVRGEVAALIAGKDTSSSLGRSQSRAQFMAIAHMVDPTFDTTAYTRRRAFAQSEGSSTPTSIGGQLNASRTVVKHVGDMLDALPALESGTGAYTDRFNALNGLRATARDQFGDDNAFRAALSKGETARKGIAGELERLLSGSHGAEASKQYWMAKLDPAQGPTKIREALDEVRSLMHGRLSSIADQKKIAYGVEVDPYDLLGGSATEMAKRIHNNSYAVRSQQQEQAAPSANRRPLSAF